MTQFHAHRWIILALLLGAVAAVAGGVYRLGYRQALDSLAERSAADLELASDRVTTQLQVYQELAVLMADHPTLKRLDRAEARAAAQGLLREVADKTAALDVFFVDRQGRVVVAAEGVMGRDVTQSDYFQRAMQGALGTGYGVLQPGGRRAYIYAAPDFDVDRRVRGALVVVADVEDVEQTWRGSLPAVFFTNRGGEVFIANRRELLFWQRSTEGPGLLPPDGRQVALRSWLEGSHEIWDLRWSPYLPERALHLSVNLPQIGMVGEILVDVAPAQRLAGLQAAAVAAIVLALGAMLVLAIERRRTLAEANAVLESRVEARTRALSATNMRLTREVQERQEAEAALKRAQEDLVQAGKLSALRQMSAGISHELNQPLMAIQQYAENGEAFVARGKPERAGENLGRIAQMAGRMARIIKNLRAFARNESEPMGRVDLGQVIASAIELTEPRLRQDRVDLIWQPPAEPVFAWGGEVRLSQVFVNLINNAADAMLDQEQREIHIAIETRQDDGGVDAGGRLAVTVRDIGPGLKEPEKIFEPFYSTKAVGGADGMGLGLSISYGLVQSFGGHIRGTNTGTGAEFTVELDRWRDQAQTTTGKQAEQQAKQRDELA
ncbi:sensor histidine kinase [Phaeobacter italicus]|uniref:sensor histidine kinase n=1 Tax=Phaeobacter italicus TaxID=481446 RepID=UPI00242E9176|nr:ATP-binding protein [Phaeobacter italicus]MCI5100365.1 ATP-binding protein [Phaeobacter italicus]